MMIIGLLVSINWLVILSKVILVRLERASSNRDEQDVPQNLRIGLNYPVFHKLGQPG